MSGHRQVGDLMLTDVPLFFSRRRVNAATRTIPAADLIDAAYDRRAATPATDAMVILSTPRSGSTLLCELLRINDGCLAHEYFQPHQYLPIAANRWGALNGRILDEAAFVDGLVRHRTMDNGWLGINLHGSHLRYFTRMEPHFRGVRMHFVHLVRNDPIAQAVSFEMAVQTGQWSSEFEQRSAPRYTFAGIMRRMRLIQNQNALIQSFLLARGGPFQTVTYEDLVDKTEETLSQFPCIAPGSTLCVEPTLRRQSNSATTDWKRKFAGDILSDQYVYFADETAAAAVKRYPRLPHLRMT